MKAGLQLSVAALALAGTSLFASIPASAQDIGDGPRNGVGYSRDTGGYCDNEGCPDDFWDYPIAYCPVYFEGEWYRGPFYYRYWQGDYYYWIRGDWRLDAWTGDRPDDACVGRFGPPEDYNFYADNGFIWLDAWRWRFFHHHHDHDHDGDRDHDRGHDHHGDQDHGTWGHTGDHGVVWDHGGDHNPHPSGASATPPASGAPAPLGETRNGRSSETGGRDRLNGGHSDSAGGGHHVDVRSAPAPVSNPAPTSPPPPNSPPPSSPPPSSGDSHHDGGFHGDFGHHHTQTP